MRLLLAQSSRADNFLAQVADSITLASDHLAQRGGQGTSSLDELPLEDCHTTSDGFHGLEQCVEDGFLQTPVVVLFSMVLLK